jgi:4-hydroxy-3-polyprenylbenzoate decarboxylase
MNETNYGVRLLEVLSRINDVETHLILSSGARVTMEHETSMTPSSIEELAHVIHSPDNLAACISSGSFKTIVSPF